MQTRVISKGGTNEIVPNGKLRVIAGTVDDEAATIGQLRTEAMTITGANTYSGNNTYTGNNNHTGTETFSHANGVTTDTITEKTAATGVTIDGVLLKDGLVAATALGNAANTGQVLTVVTTLTATEIVGTSAGDIGHASGATLVAAPGAGFVLELISALFVYDFATAAYTGGAGDAVIAYESGAAATSAITAANLLTAAGDKLLTLRPIATEVVPVANKALSLRGTAYTNPGTAAGVLRCHVTYRIHTTAL